MRFISRAPERIGRSITAAEIPSLTASEKGLLSMPAKAWSERASRLREAKPALMQASSGSKNPAGQSPGKGSSGSNLPGGLQTSIRRGEPLPNIPKFGDSANWADQMDVSRPLSGSPPRGNGGNSEVMPGGQSGPVFVPKSSVGSPTQRPSMTRPSEPDILVPSSSAGLPAPGVSPSGGSVTTVTEELVGYIPTSSTVG